MKNKSTLDIWKKLQIEGYFDKHPLYDIQEVGIPHCVEINDIAKKVVVDIGCGYGRDTWFFHLYAKKVYGIDVSKEILILAKKCMQDAKNIEFVLAEEYKKKIPLSIDYVYALHVFQHLHPEQAKDYINTFRKRLKPNGKMNVQFYIGKDKIMEDGKEPKVQYSKEEAMVLFKDFKIHKTWTLHKFDKHNKIQYEHLYVLAGKNE